MKKRIEREVAIMKEGDIILTLLPREKFDDLNLHLVKTIMDKKKVGGAYVAVNKPYGSIIKNMQKKKIDHAKLFFVDCVSEDDGKISNVVFIKSAQSLTNIGISLDHIYKSSAHSFIFIDSLDALSLYHDTDTIIKFARSIINRMREHGKFGFMISLHEGTDPRIINELEVVCDKIIRFDGK